MLEHLGERTLKTNAAHAHDVQVHWQDREGPVAAWGTRSGGSAHVQATTLIVISLMSPLTRRRPLLPLCPLLLPLHIAFHDHDGDDYRHGCYDDADGFHKTATTPCAHSVK